MLNVNCRILMADQIPRRVILIEANANGQVNIHVLSQRALLRVTVGVENYKSSQLYKKRSSKEKHFPSPIIIYLRTYA